MKGEIRANTSNKKMYTHTDKSEFPTYSWELYCDLAFTWQCSWGKWGNFILSKVYFNRIFGDKFRFCPSVRISWDVSSFWHLLGIRLNQWNGKGATRPLQRWEDATTTAGMGETMQAKREEAASAAFKGGGERQQRKDLISNRRIIFALRKQKKKSLLGQHR